MGHDVFISHATSDKKVAEQVCARLETEGFRCWIAPRDIEAGRSWSERIVDALEASRAVVVVISNDSNASQQVLREVTLAAEKSLPIIPLRVADTPISKSLQFFLATPHRLDAFAPTLEHHLPKLVDSVRQLVRDSKERRTPAIQPLRLALVYKRNTSPDDQVLNALENRLHELGHSVFIDRHMAIGVAWAQEIERQICESDAVVPLLSPASVHSEMLTYEVQVAHSAAQHNNGKPQILPVRIGDESPLPNDLAGILGRLQYFLWKSAADDGRLVEHISAALATPPRTTTEPGNLRFPGGAVELDSDFYLARPTDQEFLRAVAGRDAIILVKGARQMGKTSLLARGLQQARKSGAKVVFTDLQKLGSGQLESVESFYISLGELLTDQLELSAQPRDVWDAKRAPNVNFERFIRREVLQKLDSHLVWGLDEVDRLFTCAYGTEVFALFRTWHNERALDPGGPWSRLTLAIAYATEAHLFITDVNQSPFNVGTRIALRDFTPEQLVDLNVRYGSPLRAGPEVARLHRLVGGQPFLVRRALHELATRGIGLDELESKADKDDGPFGDHLRRLLLMLAKDPALLEVMRGILRGAPCLPSESFYRLRSAGVIAGDSPNQVEPRCGLYHTYLHRCLL